ncbi:MAG: T9SS type A sorting domain-containing protein [Bacteroidales bacterium]|nr:T9SS type A sorting domain-containing protein [Bacteroidales bacterium]MBN2818145.1 T9SS type A sorting domain-containing protein [Bacteroidales bacterium]
MRLRAMELAAIIYLIIGSYNALFAQEITQLPYFLPENKGSYVLDSLVQISYDWDTKEPVIKNTTSYNYSGNAIITNKKVSHYWFSDGFSISYNYNYSCNNNGLLETVADLANNISSHFIFNNNDLISEFIQINHGELIKHEKYYYNSQSKLIHKTDTFRNGTEEWEYFEYDYIYDAHSNYDTIKTRVYYSNSDTWNSWYRTFTNTYNPEGLLIDCLVTEFSPLFLRKYTYDDQGRNTKIIELDKNEESSEYTDTLSILEYSYDEAGMIKQEKFYIFYKEELFLETNSTYYRSNYSSVYNPSDNSIIEIFPNPATNSVSLSGIDPSLIENISFYSLSGRLIKNEIPSGSTFNIEFLPKGYCFVKIQTKKAVVVKKLLVL